MTIISPIGFVRNSAVYTDQPGQIKLLTTQIEILDEYSKGLTNITKHDYIIVVFGLDQINDVHLSEKTNSKDELGIFACRSQYRPNHLGVTHCKLIGRKGNIITVKGLDACNQSPVYDLKCPDTSEHELQRLHNSILQKNPRHDIDYDLRNKTFYPLVVKAAQLTGTLSNDLKLGVLSAMHLMDYLKTNHDASNRLQLTAHCSSDMMKGALFASGATLHTYQNVVIHRPTLLFENATTIYCYQLLLNTDIKNDITIAEAPQYWTVEIYNK